MDDNPLRCDGCSNESWPDGSLVLVVRAEPEISTVKNVRVTCGPTFDYADRLIAAHDWERGMVQRLARVLAALHRKRSSGL
jgi:hypothetical protein